MGSRTAISAGVLAVALAAVPAAAPAAAAVRTAARTAAQDCERGGGLLSGLTDTLCDVTKSVTGTVDSLTGDTTDPLTSKVDKTTDEVLGRVGEAVPTGRATPTRPAPSAEPDKPESPSPRPEKTGLVPDGLKDVCLPVLACDGHTVLDSLTPRPTTTAPSPEPTRQPRERGSASPTAPAVPPDGTPRQPDPPQPDADQSVIDKPAADADEPRVDLLWPNPFAHELTVPLQDRRVVRPTPPASDVLETVLTIALLGSAVLATRIVQQRRQRSEPVESIPFEPAHAGSRHRLA